MGLKCQILLTKTKDGFYRSGQPVIGIIRYSIAKATKFDCITVSLKGKGKCWWSEYDSSTENQSSSSQSYSGKEVYLSLHNTILKRTENAIEAGTYDLPFQFVLPEKLPSSFKDKICKIKYKVVAEISKAGFFGGTKKVDTEIPVFGSLDPCSPQPLIFVLTKCPFTTKKAVNMTIKIDKTFLLPGQDIKLNCSIKNDTHVPVSCIKTKLISETTYMSDGKHKKVSRNNIDQSVGYSPGIKGNSVSKLVCIVPTVPNLYSIQNSRILNRVYKLNVTVKFPFPHRDALVEIPVVIGDGPVFSPEIAFEVKYDHGLRSHRNFVTN